MAQFPPPWVLVGRVVHFRPIRSGGRKVVLRKVATRKVLSRGFESVAVGAKAPMRGESRREGRSGIAAQRRQRHSRLKKERGQREFHSIIRGSSSLGQRSSMLG